MLKNKVPNHLAIILDGNGRWAKSKGLVRSIGHKVGAKTAKDIISYVFDKDVKVLSLFCFSTENWKRSAGEINYLMSIPITYFSKYEENLIKKNIPIFVKTPEVENGCCYCFVEESGERTFISHHGAEYLFSKNWVENLDLSEIDSIYICGLEIEEKTGAEIVSWLEQIQNPSVKIFFAPGPRLTKIDHNLLKRIFALNPIIHLNETESLDFSKKSDVIEAAKYLFSLSNNFLFITLGEKGCLFFDGKTFQIVPVNKSSEKTVVVDTIGAGDSHIGALIAALKRGKSLQESCELANTVSKAVVSVAGASLSDSQFNSLRLF